MGEKGIPGGGAPLTHVTILHCPTSHDKGRGWSSPEAAPRVLLLTAPPLPVWPFPSWRVGGWGSLLVTGQRHRLLLQEGQSQPWAKGSRDNCGLEGWASI